MTPSIGRIVHYTLSQDDVNAAYGHKQRSGDASCNPLTPGDEYPAMIVRTWGDTAESSVQLQVFIDGNFTLWATSVKQGAPGEQRTWHTPERVS